jgi:hypothetical protein
VGHLAAQGLHACRDLPLPLAVHQGDEPIAHFEFQEFRGGRALVGRDVDKVDRGHDVHNVPCVVVRLLRWRVVLVPRPLPHAVVEEDRNGGARLGRGLLGGWLLPVRQQPSQPSG